MTTRNSLLVAGSLSFRAFTFFQLLLKTDHQPKHLRVRRGSRPKNRCFWCPPRRLLVPFLHDKPWYFQIESGAWRSQSFWRCIAFVGDLQGPLGSVEGGVAIQPGNRERPENSQRTPGHGHHVAQLARSPSPRAQRPDFPGTAREAP